MRRCRHTRPTPKFLSSWVDTDVTGWYSVQINISKISKTKVDSKYDVPKGDAGYLNDKDVAGDSRDSDIVSEFNTSHATTG